MKFISCLPRVSGSHRVLQITPAHNPSYFFFVNDNAYQLLAQCRRFSPGTPASFTTKTGRHDIAESTVKHIKFKFIFLFTHFIKSGSWRSYTIFEDHTHKYSVFVFNLHISKTYMYNIKIHTPYSENTHNVLSVAKRHRVIHVGIASARTDVLVSVCMS